MSSLKNSDDGTSATERSKDNLKDEWEAPTSPRLEEIWQGRGKWYDDHLSPEKPITKDSPACWKLTANHRSWSRRWLLLYRHGQKWQQRLNHKPQEVKKLDHSIIPLFSEKEREVVWTAAKKTAMISRITNWHSWSWRLSLQRHKWKR